MRFCFPVRILLVIAVLLSACGCHKQPIPPVKSAGIALIQVAHGPLAAPPGALIPAGATKDTRAGSDSRQYRTTQSVEEVVTFLRSALTGVTLKIEQDGPKRRVIGGGWVIDISDAPDANGGTLLEYFTTREVGLDEK